MSVVRPYTAADLLSAQQWFASTAAELFQARESAEGEEAKVQLHMVAQDAHRIAAEIERFAVTYQSLREQELIS